MATADAVIAVAMAQRGKPYVWAAAGPNSFDCSGLVVYAYKLGAGLNLPHFTGSLWAKYPHVDKSQISPGDLVFPTPSHVGIAIGNGQMVVAPHTGSVVQVQNIGTVWGGARVIAPGTAITVAGSTDVSTVGFFPGQDQLNAIVGVFNQIGQVTDWITNGQNVARIAIGALGVILIILGFVEAGTILNATKKVISSATG